MGTSGTLRAETRSISIAAPPEAVLNVVGQAQNLPRWAPAFARTVRRDGDAWIVAGDDGEDLRVRVRVSREFGTLDLLSADAPSRGAFARVIPNGEGSEFVFTLFFPDGVEEVVVARQMAVVEDELAAVRELVEA